MLSASTDVAGTVLHQVVEGLLQITMSSYCEQCHLRFDGFLQLSVCIWWWRDDRRGRTLWRLHWHIQPLTDSQFCDVTSDVIIMVVHVVSPEGWIGRWDAGYSDYCQLICRLAERGRQVERSLHCDYGLHMTQRPTHGIRLGGGYTG